MDYREILQEKINVLERIRSEAIKFLDCDDQARARVVVEWQGIISGISRNLNSLLLDMTQQDDLYLRLKAFLEDPNSQLNSLGVNIKTLQGLLGEKGRFTNPVTYEAFAKQTLGKIQLLLGTVSQSLEGMILLLAIDKL